MGKSMRRTILFLMLCFSPCAQRALAQEADSGIDLRATLSGETAASTIFTQPPRSGLPVAAGFRGVVYPTWKYGDHWSITGAFQLYTHPYFSETFTIPGYGAKSDLLQASLNYARVSDKGSVLIRAGQLSTAFGSFPLRYDDADNPLVDSPLQYGYYGTTSTLGLIAAQIDATLGKWDGRVQFANSSPANPRSITASDQYGNWAGGGGYTIRQGLRVGVSAYRGPYLDRHYQFYFPGEANPSTLSAHAIGTDVAWAHGHWNIQGEFQRFVMPYTVIPIFREDAGYAEVKRVLSPRWYIATRTGYTSGNASGNTERFDATIGFRPGRNELIKAGYELQHAGKATYPYENSVLIQFVTTLHR
jgi:hypothetical protein